MIKNSWIWTNCGESSNPIANSSNILVRRKSKDQTYSFIMNSNVSRKIGEFLVGM